MRPRNRQARIAMVWVVVAVLSLVGVALPVVLGMNGMAGGYAISFVSGFVTLIGLICAAVYAMRARILSRLLSGRDVLAHWTYPDSDRKDHTKKELAEEQKMSWTLFFVIAGFALVIGVGFLIADPEAGRYVFLVLLGLVVLLAVVAVLAPRIRYAKRIRATPEAIVSLEGACVLGILHTWRLLGARIENAEVTEGRNPMLRVTYSAPMLYGKFFYTRQSFTVTIPVPRGEKERAGQIAHALGGSNGPR